MFHIAFGRAPPDLYLLCVEEPPALHAPQQAKHRMPLGGLLFGVLAARVVQERTSRSQHMRSAARAELQAATSSPSCSLQLHAPQQAKHRMPLGGLLFGVLAARVVQERTSK